MKSLFLAAALMLAAFTTKAFAHDIKVTPPTLKTFSATFQKATDVAWTIEGHMYRADFMLKGEKVVAFFEMQDGTLVVTCHYLSVSDLPEELQQSLQAHTATATLKEVFMVQENDSPDYFATIQQADKTIVLKAGTKKWSVYKKK